MNLNLRPASVTDLPAIYLGEQDYIRTWEPAHEAAWRADFSRHLTRWVTHFDKLTVATISTDFAGYSLWMPDGDCAELCTINVLETHRRNGVGSALLDAYISTARSQRFARLRLSVKPDNPARFMYSRAGFVVTGIGPQGYEVYERAID